MALIKSNFKNTVAQAFLLRWTGLVAKWIWVRDLFSKFPLCWIPLHLRFERDWIVNIKTWDVPRFAGDVDDEGKTLGISYRVQNWVFQLNCVPLSCSDPRWNALFIQYKSPLKSVQSRSVKCLIPVLCHWYPQRVWYLHSSMDVLVSFANLECRPIREDLVVVESCVAGCRKSPYSIESLQCVLVKNIKHRSQ